MTGPRLAGRAPFAIALLVALTGAALPARAQGIDGELPGERITPGWVFTPSMAVGVSHDDNPVLASRGNPRSDDVIGVVRPSGRLTFTQKHTHVALGYFGTIVRYREYDQFDNYDQRASIEIRHQPTRRLQIFGRNSYMDTPATDAVQVAGVPFFRTGTRHDEAEAGFSYQVTRRVEVSSAYRFQWLEFNRPPDAAASLLQGGRSHGTNADVRFRVASRWRVGASWDYRHATLQGSAGAFDIQNAQALVEWQMSPTVVIEGGGGVSYLALPSPDGSRTGPAAHVSIRKRTSFASFTFGAMRSFVPAFSFGGSLRNQEVTGSVRVPFAKRRAYLQGAVAWRDSEPVLERELGVRAFWADVTAGYVVRRWLRLEAFYAGAFQDTTVAGGRVDRNRVGVQFVTSHPVRFQ